MPWFPVIDFGHKFLSGRLCLLFVMSYTVETQSLDTVSEEKCEVIFQGISLGLQQFVFTIKKTGLINPVFMILVKIELRFFYQLFATLLLCNFIEITLRHGCSPVNLLHIFRTPFTMNTSGWLLLYLLFDSSLTKALEKKNSWEKTCNVWFHNINKR